MINNIYKFGIIGCGNVSGKHIEAIDNIENAELIAVADIFEEKAKKLVEKYRNSEIKIYTDYREMLKNESIDIVDICTPPVSHAEIGTTVAEAGKHIIVEKPIALLIEDADKLIYSCKKNKVRLGVVYQNRFHPHILRLHNTIEQKRFGKLIMGVSTMRWNRNQTYYDQTKWYKGLGGGSLMNQGIHNVDLLQWMMGPVKSVFAYGDTFLHNINTEDATVAVLRFKNNAMGIIETSTCVYPENLEETIFISGEKGTVLIDGKAVNEVLSWRFRNKLNKEEIAKDQDEKVIGHTALIKNMICAIENDCNPLITGEESKKSLEIVLSVYKSIKMKKEVLL